jgi:hypothetical protein
MTDPRYTDPQLSDPVLRRDEPVGGAWGWIAGITVVALVAFLVIASLNGNSNTASNNPSPTTTGSTTGMSPPPITTGSGSTSPRPMMPAPTMPAPSKGGTQ